MVVASTLGPYLCTQQDNNEQIFGLDDVIETSAVPTSLGPNNSGAQGAVATVAAVCRESVDERRHSSTAAQDLNEYIYSVAEDHDAAIEDDDVFEMGTTEANLLLLPGNSGAVSARDAKRRTQSLGSLSGEPKSPRKVGCNCVNCNRYAINITHAASIHFRDINRFIHAVGA